MVHDKIENLSRYDSILGLSQVMEFLKNTDVHAIPVGDHPIDGKNLFVKVLEYIPWPVENGRFETHQNYADIQMVVRGREKMSLTKKENLRPLDDYNPETDFQFFSSSGEISDLVVKAGEFTIFMPNEPHRPGCLYENNDPKVRKLVFKVRLHGRQ